MANPTLRLDSQRLRKVLPALSRVSFSFDAESLRANGERLTDESRRELLAKAVTREDVSLELEVLAFEQKQGVANRNFVRFRDGAVIALGNSGTGKPFLADHNKYSLDARLGTILRSVGKRRGDGDYCIEMTVRLTDPGAVEKALRGLMSTVSIGWTPTGPVECSVHGTEIWTECYCWPGTRLAEITDASGKKKYVRDRKGAAIVEWVYTAAELTECSAVNVPAVPGARIRTALAEAGFSDDDASLLLALDQDNSTRTEVKPEGGPKMSKLDAAIAAHNELSADERKAFAVKLAAAVEAELAADPVVYTTKSGVAIRKSASTNELAMAKQLDAQAEQLATQAAETARVNELHAMQVLATRAKNEIGSLGGPDPVRIALLRAIESIPDQATRDGALELLRGANARMAELATPKGGNPGSDPKSFSAAEKIEALATKYAADHKVDMTTARALIYDTPEGAALYAEMRSAQIAAQQNRPSA